MRKLFPFKDKKSFDERHDAFYQALGRSPRESDTEAHARYMRTIQHLILFFEGKKKLLRNRVKKEMDLAAREMRFEEAGQAKHLLYALDHINDVSLIKEDRTISSTTGRAIRIEAYDIAHLAGINVVGAFTVSINGEYAPAEYRKFIISRQVNDDLAGLEEILNRRLNHTEWTYPDMIVVDGDIRHKERAESVLRARRISIPVIAVTKDERHKASDLIGASDLVSKYQKQVISLNAEAHRFVISFHRKKRRNVV